MQSSLRNVAALLLLMLIPFSNATARDKQGKCDITAAEVVLLTEEIILETEDFDHDPTSQNFAIKTLSTSIRTLTPVRRSNITEPSDMVLVLEADQLISLVESGDHTQNRLCKVSRSLERVLERLEKKRIAPSNPAPVGANLVASVSLVDSGAPQGFTIGFTIRTFTITVTNNGPDAASDIVVRNMEFPFANIDVDSFGNSQPGSCAELQNMEQSLGKGGSCTIEVRDFLIGASGTQVVEFTDSTGQKSFEITLTGT